MNITDFHETSDARIKQFIDFVIIHLITEVFVDRIIFREILCDFLSRLDLLRKISPSFQRKIICSQLFEPDVMFIISDLSGTGNQIVLDVQIQIKACLRRKILNDTLILLHRDDRIFSQSRKHTVIEFGDMGSSDGHFDIAHVAGLQERFHEYPVLIAHSGKSLIADEVDRTVAVEQIGKMAGDFNTGEFFSLHDAFHRNCEMIRNRADFHTGGAVLLILVGKGDCLSICHVIEIIERLASEFNG